MELEHDIKLIRLSEFDKTMKELQDQGYMSIPGVEPVIVYHVARVKGLQPGQAAPLTHGAHKVEVKINENRIYTLRGGKYYDADGNEVPKEVVDDPKHPANKQPS